MCMRDNVYLHADLAHLLFTCDGMISGRRADGRDVIRYLHPSHETCFACNNGDVGLGFALWISSPCRMA